MLPGDFLSASLYHVLCCSCHQVWWWLGWFCCFRSLTFNVRISPCSKGKIPSVVEAMSPAGLACLGPLSMVGGAASLHPSSQKDADILSASPLLCLVSELGQLQDFLVPAVVQVSCSDGSSFQRRLGLMRTQNSFLHWVEIWVSSHFLCSVPSKLAGVQCISA